MFAKYDDAVMPSPEGMDSLGKAGLCSPDDMAAMRACAALSGKLPANYRVMGHRTGAEHPWVQVAARWDGKRIDGDVSKEIKEAVKPLAVSYAGFADGMFAWMVEAPTPETWAKPAKDEPPKAQAGGTAVVFGSAKP